MRCSAGLNGIYHTYSYNISFSSSSTSIHPGRDFPKLPPGSIHPSIVKKASPPERMKKQLRKKKDKMEGGTGQDEDAHAVGGGGRFRAARKGGGGSDERRHHHTMFKNWKGEVEHHARHEVDAWEDGRDGAVEGWSSPSSFIEQESSRQDSHHTDADGIPSHHFSTDSFTMHDSNGWNDPKARSSFSGILRGRWEDKLRAYRGELAAQLGAST